MRCSASPRARLPHLLRERDQLLDNLCGLDGPILIPANRLLQHFRERTGLHDVSSAPALDFALEQLLEQLDREVPARHPADLLKKLVGQDGDVRLRQAGRGEDVQHLVRGYRP